MRVWLAGHVNRWSPFLASVLLLGWEPALRDVFAGFVADEEPEEPAPSRGKLGSRPEDLQPGQWVGGRWVETR